MTSKPETKTYLVETESAYTVTVTPVQLRALVQRITNDPNVLWFKIKLMPEQQAAVKRQAQQG